MRDRNDSPRFLSRLGPLPKHPQRLAQSALVVAFCVSFLAGLSVFSPMVDAGANGPGQGYLIVGSDGGAFNYGQVGFYGSMAGQQLNLPVSGVAVTNDEKGYVEVGEDGGVFPFGDAPGLGSIYTYKQGSAQQWLKGNIVGIALTADQGGYWIASNNGGVCGFGDAQVYYDAGNTYGTGWCWQSVAGVSDIVGIAANRNGGYWLVGADGGIFAFGGAQFYNSLPNLGIHVSNIVGMAPTSDGNGYWLVGSDGGVFAGFGDSQFYGSYGATFSTGGVTGIAGTPDSGGYWLTRSTGGVLSFGDAAFLGSMEYQTLGGPIVGIS